MKQLLHSAVLLTALMTQGCASAAAVSHAPDGKAVFSGFRYEGKDAYYRQTPLQNTGAFHNPILPGWYSDPSVCTNGKGDYYLVTSTFTYFPGVPVFHSTDLVNWRQIGHVLDRESQLVNMEGQGVSGGIFAPDITYNPHNGYYYMITTNVGAGNFFVKTKDPAGSWSDPVMLPEVVGIDPAFFFDDNGKAYIVNNDDAPDGKPEYDGHRTVRLVEFDTKSEKCTGERRIILNKGSRPEEKPIWCEGPHIYKINGYYYLMTAEGGTGGWHSEVIYRSEKVDGPYKSYEHNPILTQRTLRADVPNAVTCAGHADLVQAKEGDWWAVFLGCRPLDGDFENLGRETFMLPVTWTPEGWPSILGDNERVPMTLSRDGVTRGENVTFGNFERKYDFSGNKLGDDWMSLRGPISTYCSLTEVPGNLTISCAPVATTAKTVLPFVARRVQHHEFEAETEVSLGAAHVGQSAGMMLFKDETHHYILGRRLDEKGHAVAVQKVDGDAVTELGRVPVRNPNAPVALKITSDGRTFAFACREPGSDTWTTVADKADARLTSTANTGGFTGSVVGMYANDNN